MSDTNPILGDYMPKAEFAAALGCHERTIDNYRALTDGLPLSDGRRGEIFIPVTLGREWIARGASSFRTPTPEGGMTSCEQKRSAREPEATARGRRKNGSYETLTRRSLAAQAGRRRDQRPRPGRPPASEA